MKIRAALYCFLLAFIMPATLIANALYHVSIPEKVKNASIILEGEVVDKSSFWNASHSMIFTSNTVKVYKVFAGTVTSGNIQVLTQGGTVDNFNIQASELLTLEKGDAGIFFCYPNQINLRDPNTDGLLMDVYSSLQGCYKYDKIKYSAGVPFEYYASITKDLYPAIIKNTGHSFLDLQPSISFDPPVISSVNQLSITDFSPKVVNAGAFLQTDSSVLTITGTGFGSPNGKGAVIFLNSDNGGSGTLSVVDTSKLILSWTATQVILKVPSKAGSGALQVKSSTGTLYTASASLSVYYSLSTASFGNASNPTVLPVVLIDANTFGGYDVVYSSSTAGSGKNLNTAAEKAPIQRAIATWKEISGANIRENGTTTTQAISSNDAFNVIVMDNTNSTVPRLAAGVLASTYSYAYTCTSGSTFPYPAIRSGFDILIRNTGVSSGTVNFVLGPCPPASVAIDFETVVLHELGHALVLDHVIDPWEGDISAPSEANPPKIMNYALPNGMKRTTPDISAVSGTRYEVTPKNIALGTCADLAEMSPLNQIIEPKDECPLSFPVSTTQDSAAVIFDLVHATSNKYVDPQYSGTKCDFSSTSVTNTAFYAIKTGSGSDGLNIAVTNYTTLPATQQACTGAGIYLTLYRANSCPQAQNYPNPFVCRQFNANGNLDTIKNLEKNATYLLMANGILNTKANFTLTFSGPILQSGVIYTFTGNGVWSDPANWANNLIPPAILPAGSQIIINPVLDGQCVLNISQTILAGASISVSQNKSFVILSNLSVQ